MLWHGRWYVTGRDLDRDAPRVFRLSRISGEVTRIGTPGSYDIPADHDPHVLVSGSTSVAEPSPAVLRVRVGRGHYLRRQARTVGEIDDDFSLIDVDHRDLDEFATDIASHGADVRVEQPVDLQRAVVARLRATLAAHEGRP